MSCEVIKLSDSRIYRVRLLNRFQTYSLPQLRAHAKWWMARDPEVWQLITVEIARKQYGH